MTESKSGHATKQAPTKAQPAAGSAPVRATPDRTTVVIRDASILLRAPLDAVRGVLPDSPVPVALGAGALAVGGIIEWPVAGAIGLGYLALRRWRPLDDARQPA